MLPCAHAPWPYPRWIVHRGAGTLAPENTLPAFALGAAHGGRMFECDVRLSADGVPFLLHDDHLERTTNGHGPAGLLTMAALAQLDAGSWHSPAYAGTPIPALAALVQFCLAHQLLLNIELKPNPGQARQTGLAVGRLLGRLWPANRPAPLLSSFDTQALEGARAAAPALPRGLLVDDFSLAVTPEPGKTLANGQAAVAQAQALGCCTLILHQRLWLQNPTLVAHAHHAKLHCATYTVNTAPAAQHLIGLGIDSIVSDRIDLLTFSP